jgi:hypothetical protein|tara:strand:+ start:659 stop:790 length:132 start_codon:yes stop_codon:yes gene_type:complete
MQQALELGNILRIQKERIDGFFGLIVWQAKTSKKSTLHILPNF